MKTIKIIERAEKYRLLGRFDRTSAISFINDCLYDLAMNQAIKREEIFYGFTGLPIQLNGKIIKVESVDINDSSVKKEDFSVRVMQDNKIIMYKRNNNGDFERISYTDNVEIKEIIVIYTGYREVKKIDDTIEFPSEFESAIVYYVRAKMLEEIGEIEQSQYFMNQFTREMIMKSAPKVNVVSKPSEYSLR